MLTNDLYSVTALHVAAAVAAPLVGGALFLMRKGNRLHRCAERAWVALTAYSLEVEDELASILPAAENGAEDQD